MSINAGNALPTEENLRMASSSLAGGLPMSVSYLSPASDVSELDSIGKEKSIDERVFSDFTIDGSAKDFKQIKLEEVKIAAYEEKQKQKDDDFEDMLREQTIATMKKIGELYKFGDYEFELEDAQKNLEENGVDKYTQNLDDGNAAEFALIAAKIADGTVTDAEMQRAGELNADFIRDNDQYHDVRVEASIVVTPTHETERAKDYISNNTNDEPKRSYGEHSEIAANFDNQASPVEVKETIEFTDNAPAFNPTAFG